MLSTLLLLSLAVRIGALDAVAIRSFDRSYPFSAGHAPVDLKSRSAQEDPTHTEECPVCARLGTSFLPLAIPYPGLNELTCQVLNSNEAYKETVRNEVIIPCAVHQDYFEEWCCEVSSVPHYECETNVKTDLFASYNTAVVPRASRAAWLSVDTLLTYYAIGKINLAESSVELFVDITLSWKDPRLAWNLTSDNCATSILERASLDTELTKIWVPSMDLLNREEGVQSFADVPAKVYYDGTVVWKRSGKIQAFCSFVGLRGLPYDELGCQFLFGDDANQKVSYNLVDLGNKHKGLLFADYAQTYSEYSILEERSVSISSVTGFAMNFYFTRARRHYIYLIIVPTILFVIISFGQFFFDPASGERISFVLNILLVVVAQTIITSDLLPLSREKLWLNELTTWSMFFVLAGVFEALLYYIAIGKQPKKIEQNLIVEKSASPTQNNAESPDYDLVSCVEAKSDYDSFSTEEVPKGKIGIGPTLQPAFLGRTGKKLREKFLKIMTLIDYVAKFVIPISFILYLIIMYATKKNWDDDANSVWLYKDTTS